MTNIGEKSAAKGKIFSALSGTQATEFVRENVVWALAGFVLELGSSFGTAAPSSAALAAGLSGTFGHGNSAERKSRIYRDTTAGTATAGLSGASEHGNSAERKSRIYRDTTAGTAAAVEGAAGASEHGNNAEHKSHIYRNTTAGTETERVSGAFEHGSSNGRNSHLYRNTTAGTAAVSVLFGGIFGALLHGLPDGLIGISGMAIVLAARLIPRLKNVHINACVNALAAAIACFFPRSAVITEPSELLFTIIASLAAGIFAACVTYLNGAEEFDICEPKCCALAAVITALAFMSLGTLDYPAINVGRIALGFMLLTLLSYKGTAYGALLGASALVGLCAVDADIGRQAAPLCIAAFASGALSRFGKLTRAVGFVFMGCLAALIGGIDGGGWAILTETITAGALFAALPVKRLFKSDSAFSDDAVAMIMRERLCFAADAVSGIGTGLNAAAETLDRKYSSTLEQAAERAADRSCKTCPNSMICWGQKYELFRGEFERLMKELRAGAEPTELSMNGECGELCANKGAVIRAVGAEYNRYVAAAADSRRIKELRRIYTDHLSEMHDILREMGAAQSGFPKSGEMNACRSAERHIGEILCENGMSDVRVFVYSDNGRISIEAYGEGEPKTDREYLGQLFMSAVGKELELPEISDNCGRCRITARERTALSAQIGVYQLCRGKNRVCGDCCESFTDPRGALYIVLSDGMGSGSRARIDSAMVCSVMARLLKGGVPLPAALETVNTTLMVKSADESFATLDICRIDLNSGECIVYKAGAATTYIKSANRLIRVALSSPPAGTGGKLTVPAQKFTVSPGDRIIMTTDGASLDEEWLARELSSELSAKELSEEIARAARGAENGREDDISVVAVEVGK